MTADVFSSVQKCLHLSKDGDCRLTCNHSTLRPLEQVGTEYRGGTMTGYWLAVGLEMMMLGLLLAVALWALFDADRLRALWITERERRVTGSRECTCGAYRRC